MVKVSVADLCPVRAASRRALKPLLVRINIERFILKFEFWEWWKAKAKRVLLYLIV
jgi:hypothetical protein